MKKINWLCGMTLIGVALLSSGKVHAADTTTQANQENTTSENNVVSKSQTPDLGETQASSQSQQSNKEITAATTTQTTNNSSEKNIAINSSTNSTKVQNVSGIIRVQYSGKGQVAIWNNYETPRKITKFVPKNTSWKTFKVATLADNHQWYNLGGDQWIDGQYASANLNNGKVSEKTPVKVEKTAGDWTVNSVNEKISIAYSGKGQVAVWTTYANGKKIVKYVPNASSWKVFKEAIPKNGYVWYNLGGNQWITSEYANIQKTATNSTVSTKIVAVPSRNPHQPYADPADMRKSNYWNKTSETKAHPNLRNVKNLWIRVSILGNRTYVMSGNTPVYTLYSSAGRIVNGKSLTPTGTYYVQPERGTTFVGAHYYVSWKDHGVYLFHSTITNGYNGPYDMHAAKLLGTQPLSHGCVRLTVPDAKWFYQELPVGTKVVIANN
ncbi:L,D-transpeptidase [Lactobacillus sp. PV034]|uniref:L,D-transpeptidase n=1 Tax=Lactobacillus sp. PV034 TaxID=2594495 RepID=UPI00223EF86B|nr:L,D-transpeptidase [Lactobacillus sp. PV034]QNQ80092.1 L,D-transpeptidase [Lactobacillus sp. PV034]